MRLYHTSTVVVERPDIYHSREYLDFGKGFYLTSLPEQAEKYGQRYLRKGESAYMCVYELDDVLIDFKRIIFEAYNGEWLDFVAACRKGLPHAEYDIIEGGIADDQVFDTIDLYFSGIYNREQALDQLKYKRPNHQICITNQRLLDEHLHFIKAVKL